MSEAPVDVTVERDVPVPMRDGVTLVADVYRPRGDGPWPTLLMRLPYDKSGAQHELFAHPEWYARHGYVVVVQDCRGRWRSGGEWYPFVNEGRDGYDSVQWAAALPDTTGKVGMYGASYVGATQMLAAGEAPPNLACICPAVTGSDYFEGWTYEGGALHLAFTENWALNLAADTARRSGHAGAEAALAGAARHSADWYAYLPLRDFPPLRERDAAPYFFDWLAHDRDDAYWQAIRPAGRHDRMRVPALHIGGWYDIFLTGTLANYAGLTANAGDETARTGQRLVIGPWYHHPWTPVCGECDFGPEARGGIVDELQVRFFNWRLKGEDDGLSREPPVQIFVMGENRWRNEAEWPLRRAVPTAYYFHSQGQANTLSGDGTLGPEPPADEPHDVYVYDPLFPSPSFGGHSCCFEDLVPQGPYDQRPVERRRDTLCYTSDVLTRPLDVTGPVTVTLWAASSAPDTDWVAKLVDVHPDGRAINLTEGILRARFRDGLARPALLTRDEVYHYELNLRATGNVFLPGHRIRVDIASSSFPHWDRNPNSGQPLGEAAIADHTKATQRVFHDRAHPSHITLPVVPR